MPVDPDYVYADTPHPSTRVGPEWRYGCWTSNPAEPRGAAGTTYAQDGWTRDGRRVVVEIPRTPNPIPCGHLESASDRGCDGCVLRKA